MEVDRNPFTFTIGADGWSQQILDLTRSMHDEFWSGFEPVAEAEMDALQAQIGRGLPADYRLFLTTFGAGSFWPRGHGWLSTPAEVFAACHGPLYMQVGQQHWTSDDDARECYVSRDSTTRFSREQLRWHGVSLLDLIQVGGDGCCGYMQLHVGSEPMSLGFCIMHESQMYEQSPTFSEGIRLFLNASWQDFHGFVTQ